jgi:hypothetical protein
MLEAKGAVAVAALACSRCRVARHAWDIISITCREIIPKQGLSGSPTAMLGEVATPISPKERDGLRVDSTTRFPHSTNSITIL